MDKLREEIVDILHKHYYPTMHESIADCTLIECADQILALIKEAGYVQLLPDSAIMENVSLLKNIGKQNEKEV